MCHCGASFKFLVLSFVLRSVSWDNLLILNPQRHIHKRWQQFQIPEGHTSTRCAGKGRDTSFFVMGQVSTLERVSPSSSAFGVESPLSERRHVENYLWKDGKISDKVKFIGIYNKKRACASFPAATFLAITKNMALGRHVEVWIWYVRNPKRSRLLLFLISARA